MNIVAIVQARMGSTRLPGKVMREIAGKPLIGYLLERLACAHEIDGLIVAAPRSDARSPLADYVNSRKCAFYAGCEENDVADRFLAVLDEIKPDAFVRICADSPLIDPQVVDHQVRMFRDEHLNFASNASRLMPHGQSVEIVSTSLYRDSAPKFTAEDREHAGFPFFYRKIPNLCVDTEADFQRVTRIIEQMTGDHIHYGMEECFKLSRLQ